jgi:hypothetical protein
MAHSTLLLVLGLLLVIGDASPSITTRRNRPDTFKEPRAGVRWRHWIQDAYIEPGVLESDVKAMAEVGSEGFELLSYQSYGQRGPTLEDPTIFSYGSKLFAETVKSYLIEAKKNGLFMDWAMGPNQAAGVPYDPVEVDNPGFNTELVMGKSGFLPPGTIWNGSLPEPELVPLTGYDGLVNHTAPITKRTVEGVIAIQILPTGNPSAATLGLNWTTLEDLTHVYKDQKKSVQYKTKEGQDTVIIVFYSRRNGYPEALGGFDGPKPNLPGSWGSFVHDHFSLEGAQKAIESNEKWVLPEIRDALGDEHTGFAMWTDSNEFRAQLYWTDELAKRFQKDHGYNISLALPVLHGGKRPFGGANTPKQVYDYGSSYNAERFRNDYKQTLTNLYLEYGKKLAEYARSIGLKYSDQPAYNFPLDVGAAATVADIPECESLGQPSIDLIRQFSGGVNLAGRNILSSEMGAGRYLAYESTMIQQIQDARLAFAGGVNQIILHGYPSSTNYAQTSWPGLTPFLYEFSELHGPRQPGWRHYGDYLEMLGREMWLLRKGTPKIDVAVLRYGWDLEFNSSDKTIKNYVFKTADLTNAGYSYEYVGSFALGLEGVEVEGGRLMPTGPDYKALLINRAQNLTVESAERVLGVALKGLPVVILGGVPDDVPGYDPHGTLKKTVIDAMSQLLTLQNVRQVSKENEVPGALEELGAAPSAKIHSGVLDYPPVVRRRRDADTELYYIFNQGSSSTFSIDVESSFQGQSHVFSLEPRSGLVTPAAYSQKLNSEAEDRVRLTFDLKTNQSSLFVLSASNKFEGVTALPVTIASTSPNIAVVGEAAESNSITLKSAASASVPYTLSNGTSGTARLDLCGQESLNLTKWDLILQSWTPTSNMSSVSTKITNSTLRLENGLVAWDEIPGHYNTSGIGLYTTNFTWSPSCNGKTSLRAELRQPSIQHTQRAWLNGQLLPMIDPVDPRLDITSFLSRNSTNKLVIEVASPLLNALNGLNDNDVKSVGYSRGQRIKELGGKIKRGHGKYGLFGVEIVPIGAYTLSL